MTKTKKKRGGRQRRFTDLLPKGLFQVGESTEFNCIERESPKNAESLLSAPIFFNGFVHGAYFQVDHVLAPGT